MKLVYYANSSHPSSPFLFLQLFFLLCILLECLLLGFSLDIKLHLLIVIECLFVVLLCTEYVMARGEVLAIFIGITTILVLHARCWSHTDILVKELLSCEIIHEIFWCHLSTLLFIFLKDNSIQLPTDCLHNLLELECHSLVLERTNILAKLLINLADHTLNPAFDLIIDELDLFVEFLWFLIFLLMFLDWRIKFMKIWSKGTPARLSFLSACLITALYRKFMKFLSAWLIFWSKPVNFLFVFRNGRQELRIGLFAGQKFLDDILNIREPSSCSYLLESILNQECAIHFFFHFCFQESRP